MQENLLVHVHGSPVEHAALQFSIRENVAKTRKKKRKKKSDIWME